MIDPKVFAELQNRGIITRVGLKSTDFKDINELENMGFATSLVADTVYEDIVADIAEAENLVEKFFAAIAAGGEIKLDTDILIDTADMINITNNVVLDLNGHTIKKTGLTDSGKCVLFYVKGIGAELTIKGEGSIKVESGKTDIAVWADNGTIVNIESGDFHGIGCNTGSDLIYAMKGKINVSGGTFSLDVPNDENYAETQYALLNAYGGNVNNAKDYITVTGGKFYKFDPANNVSEGKGTSFVADGYESVADGDWFVVNQIA